MANAWDAGASKVNLFLPTELGGTLTVVDDGHGMTAKQFSKRWMTLRYNRLKHQSFKVEFPKGRSSKGRKAYGRNGVGRHELLCFGVSIRLKLGVTASSATSWWALGLGPAPL
ncbi:ATP-binding protein [Pseudomonas sp. E102]|uniref:ATP-binding protein n=1 Tax=Pseudomonas sp. E102 TaxID=181579 RepID=UPI0040453C4B